MIQSINQSIGNVYQKSGNQSINQSISHSTNQSINPSWQLYLLRQMLGLMWMTCHHQVKMIDQPINQAIHRYNRPSPHSINPSIVRIFQCINQWVLRLIIRVMMLVTQLAIIRVRHWVDQPVHHTINQSINHIINHIMMSLTSQSALNPTRSVFHHSKELNLC